MNRTLSPSHRNGSPAAGRPIIELPWFRPARLMLSAPHSRLLLFVGEPGTGKTTFAVQAALEATGRPPEVLSGSPEVEAQHLFGRWVLRGDRTEFVDGPLTRALKAGDCWMLIEEFSQIPIECRTALLPLRDQPTISNPLTGEVLPVSPEFRLLATSNSETLTCRRNSGAARVLFDGFQILEIPELGEEQVSRFLVHQFPSAPPERVRRVVELWQEYRNLPAGNESLSAKTLLSYRAAAHLMALLEAGMTEESEAVQIALVNKFLPTDPDLFSAAKLKNSIA